MNYFRSDLQDSIVWGALPFWNEIYTRFFGRLGVERIVSHHRDPTQQSLLDADRSIHVRGGVVYRINEKCRREVYASHDELLLEERHTNGRAGWACDPTLKSDYIAYAIRPSYVAYIIALREVQALYASPIGRALACRSRPSPRCMWSCSLWV